MPANTWWPGSGSVPALTPEGLYKRLAWALDVFRERGVRLPRDCRACRSLQVLKGLAAPPEVGRVQDPHMAFAELVAHHRTAVELFLIALATTRCVTTETPFTNAKLQMVVLGPEAQEGRDRSARNMQFELLMAARFCLGGVIVRDGEPDMLVEWRSELIGVAAKRVTSLEDSQVRKRMREAIKQIEGTPFRGIVAINLESHIEPVPDGRSIAQVLETTDAAFAIVGELASEFLVNERLLGIIAVDSLIRPTRLYRANQYPAIDTTTPTQYWVYGNVVERAAIMPFFAAWRDRWLESLSQAAADFTVADV